MAACSSTCWHHNLDLSVWLVAGGEAGDVASR